MFGNVTVNMNDAPVDRRGMVENMLDSLNRLAPAGLLTRHGSCVQFDPAAV